MKERFLNIVFIGSGAIATALGNVLSDNLNQRITLLSVENDVVDSISRQNINLKYFPIVRLNPALKATLDKNVLKDADVIFLAIPSTYISGYISDNLLFFNKDAILVNLAKGFGPENMTIPEYLIQTTEFQVSTMKGPSFARDIINHLPTAFTLASSNTAHFDLFREITHKTTIHLDFTDDIIGVELLSILKNIYAISVGIVDAHFDSPNLRFLILSRAIMEMKILITSFGGRADTFFNYCGFGDFGLTALNDLSRNRTLGLLIGKGFFNENISDKVVLEGRIAVNIFKNKIMENTAITQIFPIMEEIYKIFNQTYHINDFVNKILDSKS